MSAQPISAAVLSAIFPAFSGFKWINSGAFKSVYRVSTAANSEEVLKVICLPQDESTDEAKAFRQQELGRAMRETNLLSKIDSPSVVRLGSLPPVVVDIEGKSCLAYSEELLPGVDLKAVIAKGGQPTADQVKALLFSLIKGIQAIWLSNKTVHRDIKPANIFATGVQQRPYVILDLGIAYNVDEPGLTAKASDIPATPLYMAPEMLDPNFRDTLSYRADLYAAGLSVFEFATGGIHPLAKKGDDLMKTVTRVLHQEPLRLLAVRTDLPPSLCGLIDQLIKKNPALRPANFNLLLQQLA